MTDLARLLTDLDARGIDLSLDGARIKVDAPRGALDGALRRRLAAHKAALLAHLRPPALEAGRAVGPVPAAFAQQRLWFLDRLERSAAYTIPIAFTLDGPLDVPRLRAALEAVVARHPALRARFVARGDDPTPHMVIDADGSADLPVEDVDADGVEARLQAMAQAPFDLATGPLLRACLLRTAPERHVLGLAAHHIAVDGWSLGLVLADLSAAYAGTLADPPAPSVSYADFAVWQRAFLAHRSSRPHLDFWRQSLDGAPPLLDLPLDRRRPPRQQFTGRRLRRVIDAERTRALEAVAADNRATLNSTLLAAFGALLGRYGGVEDVVVGVPAANRADARLEGVVGNFANPLPVRLRPARATPFAALIASTQAAMAAAQRHEAVPFDRIVDAVAAERSLDRNPIFQVVFAYKADYGARFDLPGLAVRAIEPRTGASAFDLTLHIRAGAQRLLAIFEYDTALFDDDTVARLADNYLHLLEGVARAPRHPVGRLPLVAPEQLAALRAYRGEESTFEETRPVHALFAAQATAQPEAPAVTHRGQTITYGALDRRARRLAHGLIDAGAGRGDRIALLLPKGHDLLVAVLGTLYAGAAYVPFDVDQPARRLQMMVDDCEPRLILAPSAAEAAVKPRAERPLVGLDTLDLEAGPETRPAWAGDLGDLAYVKYTSGSTGRPKGVLISHRAVLNTLLGYRADYPGGTLGPGNHHLQAANPGFDIFTGDWVRALCTGGRLVLCDREVLSDPAALLGLIDAEGITSVDLVPAVANRLAEHVDGAGRDLSGLRLAVLCGEALLAGDHRRLARLVGARGAVINSYGVTEAAIHNMVCPAVAAHVDDGASIIGRPMRHTRAYVLDPDGQPLPLGVPGELAVGGAGVADGYWHRPELTAAKFVEIDVGDGPARVYLTGDRARWRPGGEMEYLGRIDHQVQLRGVRIEPGEVEAALREHPAVRDAVCMLRQAPEPMLVAWLVLTAPQPALTETLRRFLGERVPTHMVPAAFVALDALPLNPNGKVDRRALPDPAVRDDAPFVEPRDQLELQLVLLWEALLDRAPIGVTDDFFATGGESLRAVRLISQVEARFGHRLPLHALFEDGTIERLALRLRRQQVAAPFDPLVCLQPRGEKTPLFFVHAAGGIVFRYVQVAAMLGEERPFYGLQARGIEPGDPLYGSIEEMADDYVRAIRAVQPTGPYLIGGWSFGGTVAFEMARQLEAAGQAVPHLLMVDAPSPRVDSYAHDDVEFLLERLGPAAGLDVSGVDALETHEQKLRFLIEAQRLAGLFVPDVSHADAKLRLAVHKHHNRLMTRYRPAGPCATRIMFFEPSETIPFDARMGQPVPDWRPLARRGLDVMRVPGNHFNLFSNANGPHLAEAMGAWLATVDAEGASAR